MTHAADPLDDVVNRALARNGVGAPMPIAPQTAAPVQAPAQPDPLDDVVIRAMARARTPKQWVSAGVGAPAIPVDVPRPSIADIRRADDTAVPAELIRQAKTAGYPSSYDIGRDRLAQQVQGFLGIPPQDQTAGGIADVPMLDKPSGFTQGVQQGLSQGLPEFATRGGFLDPARNQLADAPGVAGFVGEQVGGLGGLVDPLKAPENIGAILGGGALGRLAKSALTPVLAKVEQRAGSMVARMMNIGLEEAAQNGGPGALLAASQQAEREEWEKDPLGSLGRTLAAAGFGGAAATAGGAIFRGPMEAAGGVRSGLASRPVTEALPAALEAPRAPTAEAVPVFVPQGEAISPRSSGSPPDFGTETLQSPAEVAQSVPRDVSGTPPTQPRLSPSEQSTPSTSVLRRGDSALDQPTESRVPPDSGTLASGDYTAQPVVKDGGGEGQDFIQSTPMRSKSVKSGMDAEEAIRVAKTDHPEHEIVGFRLHLDPDTATNYQVGDVLPPSFVWKAKGGEFEPTSRQQQGTSAWSNWKKAEEYSKYSKAGQMLVIGGSKKKPFGRVERGEISVGSAKVLAVGRWDGSKWVFETGRPDVASPPVPPEVLADYPDLVKAQVAGASSVSAASEPARILAQAENAPSTGPEAQGRTAPRTRDTEGQNQSGSTTILQESPGTSSASRIADTGSVPNRRLSPEPETLNRSSDVPPTGTSTQSAPSDGGKESLTSARKSMTTADREAMGLDALDSPERRGWQEAIDTAKTEQIPEKAMRVAADVIQTPRALSDIETAGLVAKAVDLKNQHARLMDGIGTLTDPAEIQARAADAARVEAEFDTLTTALRKSGTEKGRALASQKLTLDQDMSLVAVKARAKAAKGRDLTPDESAKIEKLTKDFADMQKRAIEAETKLAEQVAEKAIKRHAPKKRAMDPQARKAEFDTLLNKTRELLKAGCH